MAEPLLSSTSAAKARRVHTLPLWTHYWGSPGPEDHLARIWAAELIRPDLMDKGLRKEMRRFHGRLFPRDLSDSELDEVLSMGVNLKSSGYSRLARD